MTTGTIVATGHPDARLADLRSRHIDAMAGPETLRLAHRIGGREAVRRSIGSCRAALIPGHDTSMRNARHRTGRILRTIDSYARSLPGFMAELLHLPTSLINA